MKRNIFSLILSHFVKCVVQFDLNFRKLKVKGLNRRKRKHEEEMLMRTEEETWMETGNGELMSRGMKAETQLWRED